MITTPGEASLLDCPFRGGKCSSLSCQAWEVIPEKSRFQIAKSMSVPDGEDVAIFPGSGPPPRLEECVYRGPSGWDLGVVSLVGLIAWAFVEPEFMTKTREKGYCLRLYKGREPNANV